MSAAALEPIGTWTEADRALSATTVEWLSKAQPANTRRAYEWQWGRFARWCDKHGRSSLPATAETVTEYVAHLCSSLPSAATVDQALGVVLARHRAAVLERPETYHARLLLRAYRRRLAEDGIATTQAPPMTRAVLEQTVAALPATVLGRRDHLLLVLGFQMMARRSELAALRLSDVAETEQGLEVTVRTSKTDKDSRGRVVALPSQKTPAMDAVQLVRGWREEMGPDGPLLCHLDLRGRPAGPITGHGVNHAVRAAVRRAGVAEADSYTAHSLRAGGLTDALLRKVLLSVAAKHGGWDEKSPVVLSYARAADRWRDNAMAGAF